MLLKLKLNIILKIIIYSIQDLIQMYYVDQIINIQLKLWIINWCANAGLKSLFLSIVKVSFMKLLVKFINYKISFILLT